MFLLTDDTTPPTIIGCPNDIHIKSEIGSLAIPVYWSWPSATDDSERVMLIHATHSPGESFPVGITFVEYTFVDDFYNMAFCNFSVIVVEGNLGKFYQLTKFWLNYDT